LLRKPPDRAADVVLLDINLPGISGGEGVPPRSRAMLLDGSADAQVNPDRNALCLV
jgi:hypothetical protein